MALALFAITLFTSAFILLLVQPIIGKTILPKLGGAPQVWNTCMVFFQAVLLAGYFYTHLSSTKLSQRRQLILHGFLLFVPFLFLWPHPFDITNWIAALGANPLISTFKLLLAVVAVPFFLVSTSAPLLQKWFGSTGHPAAKDPYFLYGASNLGSMLAPILYLILAEPFMDLTPQKWMWTIGYVVLTVLVLACAAYIWAPSGQLKVRVAGAGNYEVDPASEGQLLPPPVTDGGPAAPAPAPPPSPPPSAAAKSTAFKKGKPHTGQLATSSQVADIALKAGGDEMTTWRRLRWIGLAAVPSSLMLGVTTHITTDLSPIPLFWLIPLEIYFLSFVLVFSKWPVNWVEGPHTFMLFLQPALICVMIFMDILGGMWGPITANIIAFGATALRAHGELAKDRPSTKHLTEFYLLMSLGGVLGGVFNAIVAPVLFIYVWEFNIAVVCACLLRPRLRERGWLDDLVASFTEPSQAAVPAMAQRKKGPRQLQPVHVATTSGASASTSRIMDILLPVGVLLVSVVIWVVARPQGGDGDTTTGFKYFLIYGIPLTMAAFFFGRPLRFGLAVAAIMAFQGFASNRGGETILYADRSYFGVLRVKLGHGDYPQNEVYAAYTNLIHGHIDHGMNILKPDNKADWGKSDKDFSRLPTTYYDRYGPAGLVMQKFDWFPNDWKNGKPNVYAADARMPVSLIGQAALPLGVANLPIGQLVDLWSEPPYATIGLGTGTMASYGRPYQHVHFYEIDNHVRRLSLPVGKNDYYFTMNSLPEEVPFTDASYSARTNLKTYFNSLKDAVRRGSELQVYMGDARLRMHLDYQNFHEKDAAGTPLNLGEKPPGGPRNFYHMMVVDAFTSDAIPAHLITKEALQMYFEHLTEEGILCVHTSNRYVNLPLVVAAVANDLGFAYTRGHDQSPGREFAKKMAQKAPARDLGRYTSEWVMVARKAIYLEALPSQPPNYDAELRQMSMSPDNPENFYWRPNYPSPNRRYLWTDDHYNLWNVIRGNDRE